MWQHAWRAILTAIIAGMAVVLFSFPAVSKLPPLQSHPLPSTLAAWKDAQGLGDYFDQVKQVPVGYLIWSNFPVTVYIQPLTSEEATSPFATKRAGDWIHAVSQAVQAWSAYLPLQITAAADKADITVWRSPPPLRLEPATQPTGAIQEGRPTLSLSRARSAETRFEFYAKPVAVDSSLETGHEVKGSGQKVEALGKTAPSPIPPSAPTLLSQRFTIHLRPDQAPSYLQAAARHELGHALGIWGHSPIATDVMYFSQVRNPPPISPRDLNTLKKVYEQPTRLGWRCPTQNCG